MSNAPSVFQMYNPHLESRKVATIDGSLIPIAGIGSIRVDSLLLIMCYTF